MSNALNKYLFISLMIASLCANAQEMKCPFFKYDSECPQRHEVGFYLGVGVGNAESRHFIDKVCERYYLRTKHEDTPLSLLSCNGYYLHMINSRLAIGGLSGGGYGAELFDNRRGRVNSFFFYGMPIIRYTYYSNKYVRLYAFAGLGLGYQYLRYTGDSFFYYSSMHQSALELSYNLSPIAITFGTTKIRLFAKLGFNREGIVNIGCNYQFGR